MNYAYTFCLGKPKHLFATRKLASYFRGFSKNPIRKMAVVPVADLKELLDIANKLSYNIDSEGRAKVLQVLRKIDDARTDPNKPNTIHGLNKPVTPWRDYGNSRQG